MGLGRKYIKSTKMRILQENIWGEPKRRGARRVARLRGFNLLGRKETTASLPNIPVRVKQ